MSKALKSTFTFKVVQGEKFNWEVEVFYFNYKQKELEPLSSSSQSTPRHLKVPFGFVSSVECVDSSLISVKNAYGDKALLIFERMSPLLDSEDSRMKRTLIKLKDQGCEKIVKTLNALLEQFHKEENIGGSGEEDFQESIQISCGSSLSSLKTKSPTISSQVTVSTSVSLKRTSSSQISSSASAKISGQRSCSSIMSRTQSVSLLTKNFEDDTDISAAKKMKFENSEDEEDSSEDDTSKVGRGDDLNEVGENEVDGDMHEDMMKTVEGIIKKVTFWGVECEDIEIPECIKIDTQKVSDLKQSLRKTPDRTQCFLGLIRTENDEGSRLGKYECWVNCELFISQMELQLEDEGHHDKVLSVVHTVSPEMNIDSKTLGSFLQPAQRIFQPSFMKS